jgi:tetratricopeptide (TPR) repeat protein
VVKKITCLVCFFLGSFGVKAQTETDIQLAQYYYLNGEFTKALVYYETLYSSSPSKVYFSRYLDCLVNTGDKKGAEKLFKKQVSANPSDVLLKIQFYFFYKGIEEEDKAKKIKNELLKQDFFDPKEIQDVLNNLLAIDEFEWAVDFIDKAKKNVKYYPFELWYAQICTAKGEKINALEYYLAALSRKSSLKEQIQLEIGASFDFSVESEELKQVKNSFLVAGQKDPSNTVYTEMLIWFFLQSKNFNAAFQQCVAFEKRTQGDGRQLIDFATTCLENYEYDLAVKALNEVINQNLSLKIEAQQWKLSAYFKQVTSFRKFTDQEMNSIIADYEQFLSNKDILRYGSDRIVLEYAEILGFYANQAPKAKKFLEDKALEKGLTDMQRAKIKLKLADVCVILDSIWDASLLYMQINDAFKFEPIGNEAKFKNARIFYFDGEFEYAQSQLDVLKQATSRFISNDAIQLSLLILENYGLDSNYEAMSAYAKSELLLLQRRYQEAFQWMDTIAQNFPQSVLNDDLLYLKGKAFLQQGSFDQALEYFQRLVSTYPTELLADDALFQIANIQEMHRKDYEAAKESYLKIIDQYPGSIYTEETRLRIRRLRGDVIPD